MTMLTSLKALLFSTPAQMSPKPTMAGVDGAPDFNLILDIMAVVPAVPAVRVPESRPVVIEVPVLATHASDDTIIEPQTPHPVALRLETGPGKELAEASAWQAASGQQASALDDVVPIMSDTVVPARRVPWVASTPVAPPVIVEQTPPADLSVRLPDKSVSPQLPMIDALVDAGEPMDRVPLLPDDILVASVAPIVVDAPGPSSARGGSKAVVVSTESLPFVKAEVVSADTRETSPSAEMVEPNDTKETESSKDGSSIVIPIQTVGTAPSFAVSPGLASSTLPTPDEAVVRSAPHPMAIPVPSVQLLRQAVIHTPGPEAMTASLSSDPVVAGTITGAVSRSVSANNMRPSAPARQPDTAVITPFATTPPQASKQATVGSDQVEVSPAPGRSEPEQRSLPPVHDALLRSFRPVAAEAFETGSAPLVQSTILSAESATGDDQVLTSLASVSSFVPSSNPIVEPDHVAFSSPETAADDHTGRKIESDASPTPAGAPSADNDVTIDYGSRRISPLIAPSSAPASADVKSGSTSSPSVEPIPIESNDLKKGSLTRPILAPTGEAGRSAAVRPIEPSSIPVTTMDASIPDLVEPHVTAIGKPARAEAMSLLQLVRDHMMPPVARLAKGVTSDAAPAPVAPDANHVVPYSEQPDGTPLTVPFAPITPTISLVPPLPQAVDLSASLNAQLVDMEVSGQWIDGLARDIAGLSLNGAQGRFQINADQLGPIQIDIRQGDDGGVVSLTVASDLAERALRQEGERLKLDAGLSAARISEVRIERAPQVVESGRTESSGNASSQQQSGSGQGQTPGQAMGQGMGQSSTQSHMQNRQQSHENVALGHKTGGDAAVLNHAEAGDSAGGAARARYA